MAITGKRKFIVTGDASDVKFMTLLAQINDAGYQVSFCMSTKQPTADESKPAIPAAKEPVVKKIKELRFRHPSGKPLAWFVTSKLAITENQTMSILDMRRYVSSIGFNSNSFDQAVSNMISKGLIRRPATGVIQLSPNE